MTRQEVMTTLSILAEIVCGGLWVCTVFRYGWGAGALQSGAALALVIAFGLHPSPSGR